MSNETSKQEYLKKYLEDAKNSTHKRKKKRKMNASISRLKIVDENIELKSLNFGDKSEDEAPDEAPVIAEIIDDRPVEMRESESSQWRKIANAPHEYLSKSRKNTKNEGMNITSQKHLSDSTRSAQCSSPIVNKSLPNSRTRHDSDSDISPPRTQKERIKHIKHDLDSDVSPPRIQKEKISTKRHDSDSDLSPQREKNASIKRQNSDSDISPPRFQKGKVSHKKQDSDSDVSPPRNPKESWNKKRRYSSNSDISHPQKESQNDKKRSDSDSDISPLHRKDNSVSDRLSKRSHSPDRLRTKSSQSRENKVQKSKRSSDSYISPPRTKPVESLLIGEKKKPKKTLSGLKAGLQSSDVLRQENQELRKREKMHINMLDNSVSGRNADTIIRDRKTGLKRDLEKEKQIKDEDIKKEEKHQQKYREWGKGVEQTQMKNNKFMDDVYEMSKPLARYKDDKDLEEQLKSVIHDDDPMSEYIKKKRKQDTPSVPVYRGPPAPPNRFKIPPGYRWDGVDRSNGYENRFFEKQNSSKAVEEEAHLWSVQNM